MMFRSTMKIAPSAAPTPTNATGVTDALVPLWVYCVGMVTADVLGVVGLLVRMCAR